MRKKIAFFGFIWATAFSMHSAYGISSGKGVLWVHIITLIIQLSALTFFSIQLKKFYKKS